MARRSRPGPGRVAAASCEEPRSPCAAITVGPVEQSARPSFASSTTGLEAGGLERRAGPGGASPARAASPSPTSARPARGRAGSRSPEAPSEPRAGTTGVTPPVEAVRRGGATTAGRTPEWPRASDAARQHHIARVSAVPMVGPSPAAWLRSRLSWSTRRSSRAMRTSFSFPDARGDAVDEVVLVLEPIHVRATPGNLRVGRRRQLESPAGPGDAHHLLDREGTAESDGPHAAAIGRARAPIRSPSTAAAAPTARASGNHAHSSPAGTLRPPSSAAAGSWRT